uniref:Uncharacterized protein n=1 Tax=Ditylenchus dipsaci TaxID=166011 RepID=A0A915DU13_9BILA
MPVNLFRKGRILADNAHSLAETILKTISGEGIAVSSTPKNEGEKVAQVTPDGIPKKRTVADTPLPKTIQETSTVGSVPAGGGNKKKNKKRKRNNQAHINASGKQ